MHEIRDLMAQKTALDDELRSRKAEVVALIRQMMAAAGVTLADLGGVQPAAMTTPTGQPRRPVKYRDDAGNTWTGIGQRPRWVQKALAAGRALNDFAVRE